MKDTAYEDMSARLMQVASKLRDIGLDKALKIPMVVFCGDQSSGKSSVLQRLSGIVVPRGVGTCTRSPMEVQMQPSTTWGCDILIRRVETFGAGSKERGLEPFISGLGEPHRLITDKFLILAQDAMRFPSLSKEIKAAATAFRDSVKTSNDAANKVPNVGHLKLDEIQGQGKNFVEDVIVVRIQGPELVYLTVIDLPGIIHSTEYAKDAGDVALIDNMVRGYMENDNAIIAATLDMSRDMEQQKMWSLIKEFDTESTRTIGVLTKLDLCQNQKLVAQVLQGEKYKLKRGHFALVNPGPKEMNMPSTDIHRKELAYFQCDADLKQCPPSRIGIDPLRDSLSALLTKMMKAHVPRMLEEIRKRNEELEELIAGCSMLDNGSTQLLHYIKMLCDFVENEVNNGLENVNMTRVKFASNDDIQTSIWSQFKLAISDFVESVPNSYAPLNDSLDASVMQSVEHVLNLMKIDPVRKLPTQSSRFVTNYMIAEALHDWDAKVDTLLDRCEDIIRSFMREAVDYAGSDERYLDMHKTLDMTTSSLIRKMREETQRHTKETCVILLHRGPYTWLPTSNMSDDIDHDMSRFRTLMTGVRVCKTDEDFEEWHQLTNSVQDWTQILSVHAVSLDEEATPANTTVQGSAGSPPRGTKLPPPPKKKLFHKTPDARPRGSATSTSAAPTSHRFAYSPTQDALLAWETVANVNMYIKLSCNRFIDMIGMSMDHFFLRRFCEELYSHMISELVDCPEPYRPEVDPDLSAKHQAWKKERDECKLAIDLLRSA